jgi:hypothetical protein
MATGNLLLKGMKVEDVYSEITKAGVSEYEAATIVGAWIYENIGRSKRTFNYITAFPAVEAACQPAFNRSFQHADWIDGESVVQAEQTVGEEGFNVRFHSIEDDLDAVAADVAKAFACVAEMRADLRAVLDEIRAELNRLNADVHECCHGPRGPRVTIPEFEGEIEINPDIHFEYVDTMKFLDKYVQVFKTPKGGLVMVPAIEQIKVNPGADPRVQRTAKLGRFIVENPRVQQRFPREVSKAEFVRTFGREEVADGQFVRDVVGILPDGGRYESLGGMLQDVATREAAALRTSDMGETTIVSAFGLDVDVKTVADAPVERFATIPPAARAAMSNAGINTMGELAKADANELAGVFEREGVAADANDAAEWAAGALALVATR